MRAQGRGRASTAHLSGSSALFLLRSHSGTRGYYVSTQSRSFATRHSGQARTCHASNCAPTRLPLLGGRAATIVTVLIEGEDPHRGTEPAPRAAAPHVQAVALTFLWCDDSHEQAELTLWRTTRRAPRPLSLEPCRLPPFCGHPAPRAPCARAASCRELPRAHLWAAGLRLFSQEEPLLRQGAVCIECKYK
jgi:hypothetical protein